MNKIALITGATAGIGLAIAHKFAENNYNLILSGRQNVLRIDDDNGNMTYCNIFSGSQNIIKAFGNTGIATRCNIISGQFNSIYSNYNLNTTDLIGGLFNKVYCYGKKTGFLT